VFYRPALLTVAVAYSFEQAVLISDTAINHNCCNALLGCMALPIFTRLRQASGRKLNQSIGMKV